MLKLLLNKYLPTDKKEIDYKEKMLQLLDNEPLCFSRELLSGHFTASAFIVNQQKTHSLLIKHAKLNSWLQPGGHCDGDPDVENVAIKEVVEETGLVVEKSPNPKIFDLDIHTIPERKGVPEHLHYDVRFLFIVNENEKIQISDESTDLKWIPFSEIESYNIDESVRRMVEKIIEEI
jgi:8-oxo-dGTP pyrophosphatase MutT (NUDIX family)